jgi:hypothetical protein
MRAAGLLELLDPDPDQWFSPTADPPPFECAPVALKRPAIRYPASPVAGVGERHNRGAGAEQLPRQGSEQAAHVVAAPGRLSPISSPGREPGARIFRCTWGHLGVSGRAAGVADELHVPAADNQSEPVIGPRTPLQRDKELHRCSFTARCDISSPGRLGRLRASRPPGGGRLHRGWPGRLGPRRRQGQALRAACGRP